MGVFDRIFAGLAGEEPKPERIMIDATHRTAANLLKKGALSWRLPVICVWRPLWILRRITMARRKAPWPAAGAVDTEIGCFMEPEGSRCNDGSFAGVQG